MIIEIQPQLADDEIVRVREELAGLGCDVREVKTQRTRYFVVVSSAAIDIRRVGFLTGVKDVHAVSDAYKLVSRKWKVSPTSIDIGDGVSIAEGDFSILAGPCSIESEEQVLQIIEHLRDNGVRIMRGGVFKPRTSPYSFQGMGMEGLKMFSKIARENGIKIITEVMGISQIEPMYEYTDIFQVGARNTQNFNLLHQLGQIDKPVLIKRGISGSIEELLQSAEYVFANGNEKLILCERGIRTFENAYRNTLDVNAIPVLKEKSHLPVVVDPSHGVGVRRFVEPVALAGVIAGADGMLIEIHPTPETAISDAQQTLNFQESHELVRKTREVFSLRKNL